MKTLNDYLTAVYADFSYGPHFYSCWGLAREVRHELYGRSELCKWGNVNKHAMDGAWNEAEQLLMRSDPVPGALACVFRGQRFVHVGVVVESDRGLCVMDISPTQNTQIHTLPRFERRFLRVEYWDDRKDLPQQD